MWYAEALGMEGVEVGVRCQGGRDAALGREKIGWEAGMRVAKSTEEASGLVAISKIASVERTTSEITEINTCEGIHGSCVSADLDNAWVHLQCGERG
jgi:hypothetical protein